MIALIPTVSAEQVERDKRRADPDTAAIWDLLDGVQDPEVPVLSLWDLGVLRNVERDGDKIVVTLTPTYSGCPAINTMAEDVEAALRNAGFSAVEIRNQLAPAWTTDWLSPEGRRKLRAYGIAPPQESSTGSGSGREFSTGSGRESSTGSGRESSTGSGRESSTGSDKGGLSGGDVPCPQCNSTNTVKISEFGSTACKALYQCQDCQEPFDYFKRL